MSKIVKYYIDSNRQETYTLKITNTKLLIDDSLGTWWNILIPVSYTHLDVYKRQVLDDSWVVGTVRTPRGNDNADSRVVI